MSLRNIIIFFVYAVLAVGLLVGAGIQLDSINRQRQDMDLIIDRPESVPPSLAFATVATGAFRGLVVDVLWMRADRLKEEGQFFDARQLAEWITTLQPRFASVWEFHAWNMAYNISVAIPATQPDQRWQWVKNGYELLRDEAIDKYQLKNIEIYRELGRIFQHKIGGISDDVHKYYKLQLALAMEPLLRSEDNQLDMQDSRYYEALAVASQIKWEQIVKDPNVAPLIDALKSADKEFAKDDEFVNNYLSLRQNPRRFDPAAFRVIDDFRGTEALKRFDIFAKAYHLRKVWKLDPVLMLELNKTFGPIDFSDPNKHFPLDWRHPDSHAIFWAVKGLQISGGQKSGEISAAETNTDRIVGHSLQNLFRNGKLIIRDVPLQVPSEDSFQEPQMQIFKEVYLRPDLRMFEPYNRSVLAIIDKHRDDKSSYQSLQDGHRNMLINAVFSFYQSGHKRQAQKIYDQLRKLYDLPEFKVSLVEFTRSRFLEELDSIGINDAKEQIHFIFMESFFLYAIRDDDEAYGREKLAEEIYNYYQKKYRDENRIDLPDFKLLRYYALVDFLDDWQYTPELRLSLLARIEIERPDFAEQLKPWKEQLEQRKEQLRLQKEEMLKSL